jgi:hypothetical protein
VNADRDRLHAEHESNQEALDHRTETDDALTEIAQAIRENLRSRIADGAVDILERRKAPHEQPASPAPDVEDPDPECVRHDLDFVRQHGYVPIDADVKSGEQSPIPHDPRPARNEGAYDRIAELIALGYSSAEAVRIVESDPDFGALSVEAVIARIDEDSNASEAADVSGVALLKPDYTIGHGGGSRSSGRARKKPAKTSSGIGRPWIEDEPRTVVRSVRMSETTARILDRAGFPPAEVLTGVAQAIVNGASA